MSKSRTITLTGRQPVRIREGEWPVIAHGTYRDWDSQYEFQANRTWRADLRVRQHADGRAVVYGTYEYDTAHQHERGCTAHAGELVDDTAKIPTAIASVARTLSDVLKDQDRAEFASHVNEAARDCVAALPAVDL